MCDQNCRKSFSIMAIDVRQSKNVTVDKLCTGFIAINKGDTMARVNGVPILPAADPTAAAGESFGIDGNQNEVFTGQIIVSFEDLQSDPYVVIVQKFYTV